MVITGNSLFKNGPLRETAKKAKKITPLVLQNNETRFASVCRTQCVKNIW
jgi:hypothetical protein